MEPLLRDGAMPRVIAHRGASRIAPENTMPAFEAAWRAGALWLETDVQPTSDDVLVLLHDDDVDRTTDGTGPIRGFTGHSVATLDAGSWFGPEFAGTRVPTLAQLLAQLSGDRRLLLEIKGEHTPRQVQGIVESIRAARVDHAVVLQSFEVPVLAELRRILPSEPVGLLVESIGDDPVADARALGAITYNPSVTDLLARPDLVGTMHSAGIAVIPWTADDPELWATLTEWGVDGIFTNTPGELLRWQAERGPEPAEA